jgi:hypothetical protein
MYLVLDIQGAIIFTIPILFSSIANSIELKTVSGSSPVNMIVPASIASGLSIDFLRDIAGKPNIEDSSLIVPLSEIAHLAFNCRFM